jgi:monoamine oxidase
MGASRREFIHRLGALGGFAAAYTAMRQMGLLGPEVAYAGPPDLAAGSGTGTRVVILGAGVAGLSAAWELGKAGYACTILEARQRIGGRNWTLRAGDRVELNDGTVQTVGFDEGLYFNAGPARIPSHHQATLGYAREFGVELEPLVNYSGSARLQSDSAFGGQPIQIRQAIYDMRGHISELLSKALGHGALDGQVTAEDKEKLVAYLRAYGDLDPDSVYKGSAHAGLAIPPGAGDQVSKARDPIDLHALVASPVWSAPMFEDNIDMQATMMQPVGGMDRIPYAFETRLADVIRRGAEVRKIARTARGVAITYFDAKTQASQVVEADYCLCTIPLKVLKDIEADFSPAYRDAIRTTPYGDSVKVAFESERFWEHEDQIYGGLSFNDRETSMVWYPSGGFHRPKGIVLGAYAFNDKATTFGKRPLADQIDYARTSVDKLHPGKGGRLGKGVAVHWGKVPYNLAPWVNWGDTAADSATATDPRYTLLSQPDGPFYFAGEHLSHVGAWQQGAFLSSHRAVAMIDARNRQGRPTADARSHARSQAA